MSSYQLTKVRKDTLKACMTCPLCNKLFKEATTISECLHTFCRKCIYDKLTDEEGGDCCPVCNIDLGCAPEEKLRPDHNLQDLRAKIFPLKKGEVKAPEVTCDVSPNMKPDVTREVIPPASVPVRRKERSLSSLVVNTPRVSAQTNLAGRRTKAVARRAAALRGSSFTIDEPGKKSEGSHEDHSESSSSPETLSKIARRRQNYSSAEPSNRQLTNKDKENIGEAWAEKIDQWRPLDCLVEAANRTKTHKSSSQGSNVKQEQANEPDDDVHVPKRKARDHKKSKVQDDKDCANPSPLDLEKPNKLHKIGKKRTGPLQITPQMVLDAMAVKPEGRTTPIWFQLIASEDQKGEQLTQIPKSFLSVQDGNMPVSAIQKYLANKLHLTSEAEVEIQCCGQPIVPTLQLHNLVDLWLQTAMTSDRVSALVGASANDFVMILVYSRKVHTS
ncbi:hypothetical protein MKX01_029498 [Papaver californicum]|nr:hypothetical protein MKX01_029498 [Papaver californicum]